MRATCFTSVSPSPIHDGWPHFQEQTTMKTIGYWVLLAVLGVAAGGCRRGGSEGQASPGPSASAAPKDDAIRVGLIASLTGKFSALGTEDKKAVELAIEQANAKGGLLGKKITLLTRDDQ